MTSNAKLIDIGNLDTIMYSESTEIFETNCDNLTANLSQPAVEKNDIKNNFFKHSAKWILKQHNLFNPCSGITNSSEGISNVI